MGIIVQSIVSLFCFYAYTHTHTHPVIEIPGGKLSYTLKVATIIYNLFNFTSVVFSQLWSWKIISVTQKFIIWFCFHGLGRRGVWARQVPYDSLRNTVDSDSVLLERGGIERKFQLLAPGGEKLHHLPWYLPSMLGPPTSIPPMPAL